MKPESEMTHADLALLQQYRAEVPGDFRAALQQRMHTRLPRQSRPWTVAGGLALAACVGVIAWLAASPAPTHSRPATLAGKAAKNSAPTGPMNGWVGNLFATTTFDDSLAQSSLIVLVKTDDIHDLTADCTVLKIIYGSTDEKTLQVDMTWNDPEIRAGYEKDARTWFLRDHGRDPTPDELLAQMQYMHSLNKDFIGILMLAPPALPPERPSASTEPLPEAGAEAWKKWDAQSKLAANAKGRVASYHVIQAHFFAPSTNAPIKTQLADAFRSGNYLKPNPFFVNQPLLEPKIAAAEAIVRATLASVTDTEATWHVTKSIKGTTAAELVLTHTSFDQRARALAEIAAIGDPALAAPPALNARISKEREALLKAELTIGQDAILLLGNLRTRGNTTLASMQGRDIRIAGADNLKFTEEVLSKTLAANPRLATNPADAMASRNRVEEPAAWGLSHSFGFPTTETQVSMASLILRARITGWKDTNVEYTVERVIYGSFADKIITFDATYGDASVRKSFLGQARKQFLDAQKREPSDEELTAAMLQSHGIEKNRTVILLLQPRAAGGYFPGGTIFDAPPDHPLDQAEADIVQIIRDGTYLENVAVEGSGNFRNQLRNADAIVRAKVARITPEATEWTVEKVLQGKGINTTLQIPHDLFRRRAQSVANFAALKDDSLKDPAKRDARITEEMNAMLKAELTPGRQAILFLGKLKQETNTTRAELQYRLYDNSKRMTLDQLESLIAKPADQQAQFFP
jgi:hypothetical protein